MRKFAETKFFSKVEVKVMGFLVRLSAVKKKSYYFKRVIFLADYDEEPIRESLKQSDDSDTFISPYRFNAQRSK